MPKIIVPYRVSGLSTVYLDMERMADNYLLADLAGTFSAAPADFPGLTESTTRPQNYEAEITTLNDGLYQISAYVRQGAAKDRQVDLHIWSQRKRYLNNVDTDDDQYALQASLTTLLGSGDTAVNHNTGSADNLRYTYAAAGVDDGQIKAYLKADYDAGNVGASYVRGSSVTGPDGRWLRPIYLNTGFTYTIVFYKQGRYAVSTKEVTI